MAEEYRKSLRRLLKQQRLQLPQMLQTTISRQICQRISATPVYQAARHIAFYNAANGEINLDALWRMACEHGKRCYFPVITTQNTLEFYPADLKTPFSLNRFNIAEPVLEMDDAAVALEKLQLILMPLLAFDERGNRLGMGAGFYDRTLENFITHPTNTPKLMGIAYQFQRQDVLPHFIWDVPLHCVITEENFYEF